MFITHKGKVMKNKRNQKNIIWKILLIIFSIVLIICLIIIGIQKYQQKKQQEYYETLLENAGSQPQATVEVPEPETEEAPDILKSLGIEIPEKDIFLPELIEAPVKKGEKVGSVTYSIDGMLLAEYPVYAAETIEKIDYGWCMEQVAERLFCHASV